MFSVILPVLTISVLVSFVRCSLLVDQETWTKQKTLPISYLNFSVPNVLRCGRICQRQGLCDAVTFDVRERICYLHRRLPNIFLTETSGRYLFRKLQKSANISDTHYKCNDTQLSVPSVGAESETCLELQSSTTNITENEVNPCKNGQPFVSGKCVCETPLTGEYCENGPRDCEDVMIGPIYIYPEDGLGKVRVRCQGNMLVIFAAALYGPFTEELNSTWEQYKQGFGNKNPDEVFNGFWIGNENIHRITNGSLSYDLEYAYLTTPSQYAYYGYYLNFKVANEIDNYTVHYDMYDTVYGVDVALTNGSPFRTYDWNTNNCFQEKQTGYWYDDECTVTSPLRGIPDDYSVRYFRALLDRI